MSEAAVNNNEIENVESVTILEPESGSRLKRLFAYIIDMILLVLALSPLMGFLGIFDTIKAGGITIELIVLIILLNLMAFLILNGYLLIRYGQTIGKWILGIAIINLEQEVPHIVRLMLLRYLPFWIIVYVPLIGGLIPILDALFIFRKDKRCLHDLLAGTMVIAYEHQNEIKE